MGKEKFSLSKHSSLIDLQVANGAIISGIYRHHEAVEDMLQCLSETTEVTFQQNVEKTNFVRIVSDESIDIAILKKLIAFIQVVAKVRVKVYFATNTDVPDGKANTIVHALKLN